MDAVSGRSEQGVSANKRIRFDIGVDIGGAFTDITVLRDNGMFSIFKTLSTPDAPERAVLEGVSEVVRRDDIDVDDCTNLVISATVGLNAIIQRSGARVGLLVTEGFEDILELGRVKIRNVFSLDEVRVPPLVRKDWVHGISQRMGPDGEILRPLDRNQLVAAAGELINRGATSLAVIFLHAHRNDAHEVEAVRTLKEAFSGIAIARSSEIWPQSREYERATALVMNSFIAPTVSEYVGAITKGKNEIGLKCPVHISASNGGLVTDDVAMRRPITTLLSGPSAGVVAAVRLMRSAHIERGIAFDMGGTSADICVLEKGAIPYAWGQEIEGLPVAIGTHRLYDLCQGSAGFFRRSRQTGRNLLCLSKPLWSANGGRAADG